MRRLLAVSAAGVLLAGGATISVAGTASAATPHQVTTNRGCGWYGPCGGYGYGYNFFGNGFRNGLVGTGVVVVVVG
ncbi:hypothetical protein GT045_07460 [Streptomyces sp. SID486]|nr:hypothetical protein [Streptomyces sp. SID2955]MYW48305.1 hypothetical protein [Streptomyces sp. SID161]MYX94654.1 hypothetical protein [Streptomyces sp. SID486]